MRYGAQIRGLEQASENIQDGILVINVMDAALGTMQSPMLNRLREIIIQGANDTNTDPDRELIQKEINEIIEGIDDIVHNTEFNTIKPFIPPSEIIPGTPGGSGKADIVFVIDNTGSMGAQIQNVKNNIGNFVSALKAHNIDVNLGLVTYGDDSKIHEPLNPIGDTVTSKSMGFPLDVDQFKNQVEHIEMSNGGDGKESGLEGIMEAHKTSNFRPGATYILITDAPVHERLPSEDTNNNGHFDDDEKLTSHVYSEHTIKDVINKIDGEVKLTVITNSYANSQLESLHSETNGLYKETIKLQKNQVLRQASQSMMAQINQMGRGILQFLG